jgi:2'-5' RNA ligase
MALLVIAYPKIKNDDYQLVQEFRKQYDELLYSVVEPHFTFVFPVFDFEKNCFINETITKSKNVKPIDFEIKCSTVNSDPFSDYYHLLLVPDKGYSDIVKVHDKLYSGVFFKDLRLDIDFIPHIAIANSKDKLTVKKWADMWNSKDFTIAGTIKTLTVVDYIDNIVTDLVQIQLE